MEEPLERLDKDDLEYLEKVASEKYKFDLDTTENIWRTLPFFATSIALELNAFSQLRDSVNMASSFENRVPFFLFVIFLIFVTATLYFLTRSVAMRGPRAMIYPASEEDLFTYAVALRRDARLMEKSQETSSDEGANAPPNVESPISIKQVRTIQLMKAASHNNKVHATQLLSRQLAALLLFLSLLCTLGFVCIVLVLKPATPAQPPKIIDSTYRILIVRLGTESPLWALSDYKTPTFAPAEPSRPPSQKSGPMQLISKQTPRVRKS